MKMIKLHWVLCILFVSLLPILAEQPQIRIVDMQKVFNANLEVEKELVEIQKLEIDYKKNHALFHQGTQQISDQLTKLSKAIERDGLTEEEKTKLLKTRNELAKIGLQLENQRSKYIFRSSDRRYKNRHQRLYGIYRSIGKKAVQFFKSRKIDMVMDASAKDKLGLKMVIYYSPKIDLTNNLNNYFANKKQLGEELKINHLKIGIVNMASLLKAKKGQQLDQLTKRVKQYAIENGYDLVLNSTSESTFYTKALMLSDRKNDLTEKILESLK